MSDTEKNAVEASIKHWEENKASPEPWNAPIYGDDCALCGLYDSEPERCPQCPLARAGLWCPKPDSPWMQVRVVREKLSLTVMEMRDTRDSTELIALNKMLHKQKKEWDEVCDRMLDALRGLL